MPQWARCSASLGSETYKGAGLPLSLSASGLNLWACGVGGGDARGMRVCVCVCGSKRESGTGFKGGLRKGLLVRGRVGLREESIRQCLCPAACVCGEGRSRGHIRDAPNGEEGVLFPSKRSADWPARTAPAQPLQRRQLAAQPE
eukprot:scaffold34947_cov101-Isochrysis_galbana.AAC.1